MTEAETDQEHDISMFASLFNDLLAEAGLTRLPIKCMETKDNGSRTEFTFSPTNRSVVFTYNEDKCKLQITITRQYDTEYQETVDLYDKKDWYKVEERLNMFMEDLKKDLTFGIEIEDPTSMTNRPSCERCGSKADYRIPDMNNHLVRYLCTECFVGDDMKCSLCGITISNSSYSVKRVCHPCTESILRQALVNRPAELKQFIVDVAGDLFKEITRLKIDGIVDQAKYNV